MEQLSIIKFMKAILLVVVMTSQLLYWLDDTWSVWRHDPQLFLSHGLSVPYWFMLN